MTRSIVGLHALRALCVAACGTLLSCADAAPTSPHRLLIAADVSVNAAPSTVFSVSPRYPAPGDTVTVDGTYSHDADGQVVSYQWNFGNGTVQNTSAVARTVFSRTGTYTVSLTTVDDSGTATNVTLALVVGNGGAPPTAVSGVMSSLSLNTNTSSAGTGVTATVTVRNASGAELSGVPVAISARGRNVQITPASITSDGGGIATSMLTTRIAQALSVRAIADFTALTQTQSLNVTPAIISAAHSSIRITQASIASSTDSAIVEVSVRDSTGNAVPNAQVVLTSSVPSDFTLPPSGFTNADGRWIGSVRAGAACGNAVATLSATAGSIPLAVTVTLASLVPGAYSVCGPNFWIDASDASSVTLESGNRVREWRDKSGAGMHVTAPSASNQRPTWASAVMGGRAAVTFAPSLTQYLANPGSVDARTIFAVFRNTVEPGAERALFSVNSSLQSAPGCSACGAFYLMGNEQTTDHALFWLETFDEEVTVSRPRTQGIPVLVSTLTTSTQQDLSVNRGSASVRSITSPLFPRDGETTVGVSWYNTQLYAPYSGEIAELVTYNRALTATERETVERALMLKWGLGNITKTAGDAQSATAGTSPATAPQLRITDGSGNAIVGAHVTFQITSGSGRINGATTYATTTDVNGYAAVPVGSWVIDGGANALTAWYGASAGIGSNVVFSATGTLPSGLMLRLDASDTTSLLRSSTCGGAISGNTQAVGCWLDKSGNAAHAIQTISGDEPVVNAAGIGGRRSVGFTLARENWLDVPSASIRNLRSAATTIVAVARAASTENSTDNSASAIAVWQGYHNGMMLYGHPTAYYLGNEHWARDDGGPRSGASLDGIVSGTPFVGSAITSFSSATEWESHSFLNGSASAPSTATDPNPGGVSSFHIGQGNVAPSPDYRYRLDGQIGEVLLFNRALTTVERQRVERYLGWKWGVLVQ